MLMPVPFLVHLSLNTNHRVRVQVGAPSLRSNLIHLFPTCYLSLFFSHSNFPFVSYHPRHPNLRVYSGLVELSLLCPPMVPSTYFPPCLRTSFPLPSQSPLIRPSILSLVSMSLPWENLSFVPPRLSDCVPPAMIGTQNICSCFPLHP